MGTLKTGHNRTVIYDSVRDQIHSLFDQDVVFIPVHMRNNRVGLMIVGQTKKSIEYIASGILGKAPCPSLSFDSMETSGS